MQDQVEDLLVKKNQANNSLKDKVHISVTL